MIRKIEGAARRIASHAVVIGLASLGWLLLRSGSKPSRITYPCQKAAAANCYTFLLYPAFGFLVNASRKVAPQLYYSVKHSGRRNTIVLGSLLLVSAVASGMAAYSNFVVQPVGALQGRTSLVERLTSVSVVRVEDHDIQESLESAINQVMSIEDLVPEGSKVLIKANIVRNQAPPDTIDPATVKALIDIVKQRDPSVVWVGDGSGEESTFSNMLALGYGPLGDEAGVELVDLNFGELVDVPVPGGGYVFDGFKLNRMVVEADVFISLACMKTHDTAVVTLSMKNLIGIAAGSVYGVPKMELHARAEEKGDDYMGGVISDLCGARKIDLAVIDGRVAMEGQGPHAGDPVDLGLLVVGTDPVATDSVASAIMGFDPEKVPTLELGQEKGLGTNDLHTIEVVGEKLEEVFHPFMPAEGHDSFVMTSSLNVLFYRWRTPMVFSALLSVAITILVWFKFRGSEREQDFQVHRSLAGLRTAVDASQPLSHHKREKSPPAIEVSASRVKDDVDSCLEDFQNCMKRVGDATLRLEELAKLFKSGEITQASYELLLSDLGERLFLSVQEAFRLRESLELARARAKMEGAKMTASFPARSHETEATDLKYVRGFRDVVESDYWSEAGSGKTVSPLGLQQWEGLVSKIDSVLSSLSVEKEAAIIHQYLALLKGEPSTGAAHPESKEALAMFQKRLLSVSDKWTSMKRSKVERIMDLRLQASEMEDRIKEVEARFSVGELSQTTFEYELNSLKGSLKKLKDEISDIRSQIDDVDTKIFRASDLLEERS